LFALALALLAPAGAAPPPVIAPPPIVAIERAPVSAAALKLAQRLEEVTEPRALMVATNYAAWEATVRKGVSLNPALQKMEQAYPGVINAGIDAARPIARQFCDEFVTRFQRERAETYARALTEKELAEAVAFFETPAAQRVMKRMLANTNPQPLIEQVAQQARTEGKITITKEQAAALDRAAALKTQAEVSAEDQVAVMRFSHSAAGRKYVAARNQSEARLLEMVNASQPDAIRRQNEAVEAGMLAFIDRKKSL
jgi:hypothetical protein